MFKKTVEVLPWNVTLGLLKYFGVVFQISLCARGNDTKYLERNNASPNTWFQLPVVQAGEFYVDQIRCESTGLSADLENAVNNFAPRLKVCEHKTVFGAIGCRVLVAIH